ncbi:MAG: T9SS type A sorting domain-containing protein, partial [Calditrichaceae bacterium]
DRNNTTLKIYLDLSDFISVESANFKFVPEYGNESSFDMEFNDDGTDGDSLAGDGLWTASKIIANRKYPFKADLIIQTDDGEEIFENISNNLRLRPSPKITDFHIIWENGRQDRRLNSGERARLAFTIKNPDGLNWISSLTLRSIQSGSLNRELQLNTYIPPLGRVENPDFYVLIDASVQSDSIYFMLSMDYDQHHMNIIHSMPITPWVPAEIKNDTLQVEVINGLNDMLLPVIADPTQLTGHIYKVSFYRSSPDDSLFWQLSDKTTNTIMFDEPWNLQQFYNEYPIVDGIEWRAPNTGYGIEAVVQVADANGPLPDNYWDSKGQPFQGNNVWHSTSVATDSILFYLSSGGVNAENPDIYLAGFNANNQQDTIFQYNNHDFEIRFGYDDDTILYDWFENHGYEQQPISVWDIGLTKDDPSDDLRMLTGMYLPDTMNSFTGFSYNDPWIPYNASGWLYARRPLDDQGNYNAFYQDITSDILTKDWWDHSEPALQRIIFCHYYSYYSYPKLPQNGTIIRLITRKHFLDGYEYTIQSPSAEPDQLYDYPRKYKLLPNYPNPFNATTRIPFEVPKSGKVNITIYNILGQKIVTILDREFTKGWHSIDWDGRNQSGRELSSGLYIAVLSGSGQTASRKLLLLK